MENKFSKTYDEPHPLISLEAWRDDTVRDVLFENGERKRFTIMIAAEARAIFRHESDLPDPGSVIALSEYEPDVRGQWVVTDVMYQHNVVYLDSVGEFSWPEPALPPAIQRG